MFQTTLYQKVIKISKPVLVLVLTVFIFFKLFYSYQINTLFQQYELQSHLGESYFLIAAVLLMFFNWGIEAKKWQILVKRFEPISFGTALKAVLSGVTLSIITPNQIGDFAGRVIHLEVLNKVRGSLVTVIGHTAQVIVTLAFGLLSMQYFSSIFPILKPFLLYVYILIPLLVLAYLKLDWIYSKISLLTWIHRFEKYVDVFGAFGTKSLSIILVLSFLRYLVFLSQYYLLLRFFQVQIEFWPAIACIIGTFCVQSVVPSFLLLEIGLRGASALFFLSMFSTQHEAILLSAYSLWIVNMLTPAIFGMYFIYKVRT